MAVERFNSRFASRTRRDRTLSLLARSKTALSRLSWALNCRPCLDAAGRCRAAARDCTLSSLPDLHAAVSLMTDVIDYRDELAEPATATDPDAGDAASSVQPFGPSLLAVERQAWPYLVHGLACLDIVGSGVGGVLAGDDRKRLPSDSNNARLDVGRPRSGSAAGLGGASHPALRRPHSGQLASRKRAVRHMLPATGPLAGIGELPSRGLTTAAVTNVVINCGRSNALYPSQPRHSPASRSISAWLGEYLSCSARSSVNDSSFCGDHHSCDEV